MEKSTNKVAEGQKGIQIISPSLPKGGGSVQGMGETFAPNEFNGSASMTIPIPVSPCRGFEPSISLNYSSGNGNSPFGMGWELSTPEITRRTSKRMPTYTDEDTFLNTAGGTMVPYLDVDGIHKTTAKTIAGVNYEVDYYQARSQGAYDKVERYRNSKDESDTFWKVTSAENMVSIFGKNATAKVFDPENPIKIAKWLLEEVYDSKGNHQIHTYIKENNENIPNTISEVNRDHQTQTYPAKVYYGNDSAIADGSIILGESVTAFNPDDWHFEIVFDYGTYDIPLFKGSSNISLENTWPSRQDSFSDYSNGFEIRTYRLCKHVLLFHRFKEIEVHAVLTNVLKINYEDSPNITQLTGVVNTGYQYLKKSQTYNTKSLPELTFSYTSFAPAANNYLSHSFERLESETGQTIRQASDSSFYQMIDLYGEGIPGILYNDGQTISYRAPQNKTETDVQYGEANPISFPVDKIGGTHVLNDVTGNGRLDLMVSSPQHAGYYQLNINQEWQNFEAFEGFPSNYLYPGNSQLDVTGDGVADVLLIEENDICYNASLREKGYAPSYQRQKTNDVPSSKHNAPNELLLYADMIGSGLSQRVRITQNSVECWPNLGYGKFGKKVMMNNVPDFGSDFNINRLLWADIDGSGTTDLTYLHTTHVDIYLNQSGNSFSETPIRIPLPSNWDSLCQVQFADVKGNGTNCLVFAKTHPLPQQWYYDFNLITITDHNGNSTSISQKPWLLCGSNNNMGAQSTIVYASSTKFYLEDKAKGTPWITNLPFPVNVIESVTHHDEISNTQTTSSYYYSHGYYDGFERTFRGFGRVDRTDASSFANFKACNGVNAEYKAPPAFTRTWYHTGAYIEQEDLLTQYKKEYWNGDSNAHILPDTHFKFLTTSPTGDTLRDAHRTLHGSILRTEVYGNDDTPWQVVPYSVSETQFRIEEKQALLANKYSVFQLHVRESIAYDYERNAADPRISHSFILKQDYYGHVLESCAVSYPRRVNNIPANMDPQTKAQQLKLWVSLSQEKLFNSNEANTYWGQIIPSEQAASGGFLLGLPIESKSYEVNGLIVGSNGYFTFPTLKKQIDTIVSTPPQDIEQEVVGFFKGVKNKVDHWLHHTAHSSTLNLLHWERDYYFDAVTKKELLLGTIKAPVLPHRTEFVEFDIAKLEGDFDFLSKGSLQQLMTNGGPDTRLARGGYITTDDAILNHYWNPGSSQSYFGTDNFCLPEAYYDPFQYKHIYWGTNSNSLTGAVKTIYEYDQYHLFANKVTDPLGNTTSIVEFDYRTLHPATLQDINHNTSSVIVDPLGRVIATSKKGTQAGETVSFNNVNLYVPVVNPTLEDVFSNPEKYLQGMATFFYYDLDIWEKEGVPCHTASINYTDYTERNGESVSPVPNVQKSVSYHDGFGRALQSKVYFDGQQETRSCDVTTQKVVELTSETCWLVSGATFYDDKGQAIEQYEPYFSPHWKYVDETALNKVGYSSILFYDALGRHVLEQSSQQQSDGTREGFFAKTLFGNVAFDKDVPIIFDYNGLLNKKLYSHVGGQFTPSPWSTLVYDENDCINESNYQPKDGVNIDKDAFEKAKVFANTPHIHIEDSLGNVVQSEQLNVLNENERNANYFTFDILGDKLTSADQRLHLISQDNFQHRYNLTKESIQVVSADAGIKWSLTNVVGHPIFSSDSRGTRQYHIYDILLRPVETFVQNSDLSINQTVQKVVYGDSKEVTGSPYFKNPSDLNLRGKPVIDFDQAGLNLSPSFDINGNALLSAQWLRKGYKEEANWNTLTEYLLKDIATSLNNKYQRKAYSEQLLPSILQGLLETETYIATNLIDAIGRALESTDADGNKSTPEYFSINWIKGLNTITGALATKASVDAPTPGFSDVCYDAKGQRQQISYANGTKTYYEYDPFTFELTEIKTTRKTGATVETIQHLQYHHDPVGNVTSVQNHHAPTIWYNNQQVDPKAEYTYDALYKLIEASGREHAGMWNNDQSNQNKFNEQFYTNKLPQLSEGNALQNYTQKYQYDNGGNLIQLKHIGKKSSTRNTTIQANSNRIKSSGLGTSKTPMEYSYDDNGNMTNLAGLSGKKSIAWNYRDNMHSATVIEGANTEYYVYNGAGTRVRKVHEIKEGKKTTIKEVVYLGGIELRKTYTISGKETKNTIIKEWHNVRLADGANTFCTWRYQVMDGNGKNGDKKVQLRYQYSDSLNSSTVELDENAHIITFEEYFPYGGTSIVAATNQKEIKNKHYHYSNKEKDGVTGLYYYGMRYYCSWLGRWTCTDPAGTIDGLNIYDMVEGNPVTHVDVGGMGKKKTPLGSIAQVNKKKRQDLYGIIKKNSPGWTTPTLPKVASTLKVDTWNTQNTEGKALTIFEAEKNHPDVLMVQESGKPLASAVVKSSYDKNTGITTGHFNVDQRQYGHDLNSRIKINLNFIHVETGSKDLMIISKHTICNPHLRIVGDNCNFRPALCAEIDGFKLANIHLVSGKPNFASKHLVQLLNNVGTDKGVFVAGDANMNKDKFDQSVKQITGNVEIAMHSSKSPTQKSGSALDHGVMIKKGATRKVVDTSPKILSKNGSDHNRVRHVIS